MILWLLTNRRRRCKDLHSAMPVAHKVLAEQLRQLWFHPGDIAFVVVDQSCRGGRMFFRISLHRSTEALDISETEALYDCEHLGLIALHLVEPNLVNLCSSLI